MFINNSQLINDIFRSIVSKGIDKEAANSLLRDFAEAVRKRFIEYD